ncbi:hypothetical protein ROHU_006530 [Labeo rohita]|uniref:Uncharacterized protein n=1 Tax=Labeo rohita TaxID=84645 RepID=A0A498MTF2_LABRO|nr:hypothetical protein ROHU_006530 [Labeo rohita]
MELVIFIVFQLMMEVQSYNSLQKPIISVSDDDAQPTVSCEIPLSVRADFICSLYTEDDDLLYQRVSQRSLPPAKLRASALDIVKTDTVELSCENTEDLKMEMCYFNINGRENSTSTTTQQTTTTTMKTNIWFIVLVFTGVAVILSGLTGFICLCRFASKKRRKHQGTGMSCSGPAETYSLITSVPATSQPISADTLFVVPVSTGVAVIMLGLICLCWCASKKRRKQTIKPDVHSQEPGMSCPGPGETYSLITSVPATSQPISGDALVNKKQKWGNTEENVNVNHLYATVSRKPVKSNSEDQV